MSNMNDIDKSDNRTFESDLLESIGKPFDTNGLTIMLCTSGYAVLSIDFKHRPLRTGDVAIIPNLMSLIPIKASSGFRVSIISINPKNCEEMEYRITDNNFWDYLNEHPILHPDAEQHRTLCSWMSLMERAIGFSNGENRNGIISAHIYTSFLMLQGELMTYIKTKDKCAPKGRAIRIVSDFNSLVIRYHKKHREVAYYANILSVTPDYLNRLTKIHWKMSAKEHIDWYTIMAIKNYLTSTDLSIKCIAANLNYEDASYMCRFFKKEAGMSPIEFRNKTKYREL